MKRATPVDFTEHLGNLGDVIERARASHGHEDVLAVMEAVRQAQRLSEDAEGRHVDEALAQGDFDFDTAQTKLARLRKRLAGLALRAQEALYGFLSTEDRRELSQAALVELNARMVDQAQLEAMRNAHVAIRAKRARA